jgi:hypothetical protein
LLGLYQTANYKPFGSKDEEVEPLSKLSRLQRLILVMLLDERIFTLGRREFRRVAKGIYWGAYLKASAAPSVAASTLGRALSRLEARGLIVRTRHGWRLTEFQLDAPGNCGEVLAINAWRQQKERYAQIGLKGSTLKSLGLGRAQSRVLLQKRHLRKKASRSPSSFKKKGGVPFRFGSIERPGAGGGLMLPKR